MDSETPIRWRLIGAWSERINCGWAAGQFRVKVRYDCGHGDGIVTHLHHAVPQDIADKIVFALQKEVRECNT